MPNHIRAGHLTAIHIGNTVTVNGVTGRIHDLEHRTSIFGGDPITIVNLRLPDGTSNRQQHHPADPVTLVDPPHHHSSPAPDAPLTHLVHLLEKRAAMWKRTGDKALTDRKFVHLDEARASEAECRFLILELTEPTNADKVTTPPRPTPPRPAHPACQSGGHDNCTCDICY
ncbi:hypothetical protein [Microcella sp.]|uniref:hypothetical protein n=1 Tax=Microcella sp. TaxID=1913979 RepID=UPI003919AB34